MSTYNEIIEQDSLPSNSFDDTIIDMTIDNFVEENCPNYLYLDYNLFLSQKEAIKGKILELIDRGNSLMDKEWVENIICGYYPKDELWLENIVNLELEDIDKKIEIFSDKAKFGEYVNEFYLNREEYLEKN